jgi:peptidoglycan/LPS O-acetylase OafA/YrhL
MENSSHKYIPKIDHVRACAFLLVAMVHFAVPNWTGAIANPNILETVVVGVIKTGWIGVPLFLFISGYSLAIGKTGPGYTLDIKQFFINRVLRIFPVWIVCVLIMKWSHKLSGADFLSVLLLNVQAIPPETTPFGLVWSIQLEFLCYFIFPILLASINNFRQVGLIYLTLLAFKIAIAGGGAFIPNDKPLPTRMMWELTYGTLFGAATIFLSGMLARRFVEQATRFKYMLTRYAAWSMGLGMALLVGMVCFIDVNGGWQEAEGRGMTLFFLLFPEFCSIIFALIVLPYFLMGQSTKQASLCGNFFAHIGMVSYSAYMFSGFINFFLHGMAKSDLMHVSNWDPAVLAMAWYFVPFAVVCISGIFLCVCRFMQVSSWAMLRAGIAGGILVILAGLVIYYGEVLRPQGWISFLMAFTLYLTILIAFSTLTFYTIEKPFLSKRKAY